LVPLRLTDQQLDTIHRLSWPLVPADRAAFLQAVAAKLVRVLINAQIAAFNGTFASVSKKTFAHTLTDEVTQAHDASWPVLILKCPTKSPLP
jgi:hypothetical protein